MLCSLFTNNFYDSSDMLPITIIPQIALHLCGDSFELYQTGFPYSSMFQKGRTRETDLCNQIIPAFQLVPIGTNWYQKENILKGCHDLHIFR